jgi:hypothetical protein
MACPRLREGVQPHSHPVQVHVAGTGRPRAL